jgi:hypothetical protein
MFSDKMSPRAEVMALCNATSSMQNKLQIRGMQFKTFTTVITALA